ncbi:MAG: isoprenylcysteine carboxylmethyltransferase family protein [Candidatus Hatepunaea meridiana]|nr:isoprenylcysteine carboxylmethyltransferase family protein [Candidatus Hatepunaea meridiana]
MGYITVIVIFSSAKRLNWVGSNIPKPLMRVFMLSTFIAPPVILPFTEGPKITIPTPAAIAVGIILIAGSFIIRIIAQRLIGALSALKGKAELITTGIYGISRHPLYLGNFIFAAGMAILFRSMYAFLFSILYGILYLLIIHFEERDLFAKYGEEYAKYRRDVGMVFPSIKISKSKY